MFTGTVPVAIAGLNLAELDVSTLKAWPEIEDLVEVGGCLGHATEGEKGGSALEVSEVVVRVARNSGIVVSQGFVRFATG